MTTTLVKFGNVKPKNVNHDFKCVSYIRVPEENDHDPNIDLEAFRNHLAHAMTYKQGITNFPGSETLQEIVSPGAIWSELSEEPPAWVDSDDKALAELLGQWYHCPVGEPDDVEDTHYTNAGPPGVKFSPGPQALVVNTGYDIISRTLGGLIVGVNQLTATGSSATTLTDSGASWTVNAYTGCVVVDNTTGVFGIIESNTATVLTVDRWYNPATPGGAAASTPGTTDKFTILSGGPPAWFMGISTTNSASSATDTSMAGEITTAGGGLVRAIATYAHTASASTYTLANTFTANGSDTLPAVVYRLGAFISMVVGWSGSMLLETLLNVSATLAAVGDAVTCTDTVTV